MRVCSKPDITPSSGRILQPNGHQSTPSYSYRKNVLQVAAMACTARVIMCDSYFSCLVSSWSAMSTSAEYSRTNAPVNVMLHTPTSTRSRTHRRETGPCWPDPGKKGDVGPTPSCNLQVLLIYIHLSETFNTESVSAFSCLHYTCINHI